MAVFYFLLLILQITYVHNLILEDTLGNKWSGKCEKKSVMLNDCNWCKCSRNYDYQCTARPCQDVDMFGHFNDAIREYDPGMEGHGVWRSKDTACEPNVPYTRGNLLCICNENGYWPNPVCSDVFRVLHSALLTKENENSCIPNNRYVVGCNVCICSPEGQFDSKLCTKKKCTADDPVLNNDKDNESVLDNSEIVDVYAECSTEKNYRLGCKNCKCLRNNRLYCNNCTDNVLKSNDDTASFCDQMNPWIPFSRECNLCYCDANGFMYCSTKKCLTRTERSFHEENEKSPDECVVGKEYKVDCNHCYCTLSKSGVPYLFCTLMWCNADDTKRSLRSYSSSNITDYIQDTCVKGTFYEKNCLICTCDEVNGKITETCDPNPKCQSREARNEKRSDDLDSLHGYCEPLHVYNKECNKCTCLTDGKTIKCSSNYCEKSNLEPIDVDIVPIRQPGGSCPKGMSYKIGCNYCFCLSNGNALCTTTNCKENK